MRKLQKGSRKIENGVVEGIRKSKRELLRASRRSDKCVEVLFAKEGEGVKETNKRLSGKASDKNNQ